MFLNTNILCRLMKQAYKEGGLVVARSEERLYLAGLYWRMDCKPEFVPNKVKGLIIELCGELPDKGERFNATKDGNQMEGGLELQITVRGDAYESTDAFEITDFLLMNTGVAQRILQSISGKGLYLLNNVFVCIIDPGAIDADRGETSPGNPIAMENGAFWQNNVCRFHARFRHDDRHKRHLKELTMIDLTRDPEVV